MLRTLLAATLLFTASFALANPPSATYKRWLNEDVAYLATPQDRAEFLRLQNDKERDKFIETFWKRHDPTPDTPQNEFKEEHYRRLAYANQHFAAGLPGWKTDRGRIYIVYGPPDRIESHGVQDRTGHEMLPGMMRPYEVWHYQHAQHPLILKFVDECTCGDYRLEKNSAIPAIP